MDDPIFQPYYSHLLISLVRNHSKKVNALRMAGWVYPFYRVFRHTVLHLYLPFIYYVYSIIYNGFHRNCFSWTITNPVIGQNESRDSFRPITEFVMVQEKPLLWKPL